MPTPQRNSDRIVVVGTSSVGKTSFAKRLAAARALPRIELDSLYWERHWQPKPEQELFRLLGEATLTDRGLRMETTDRSENAFGQRPPKSFG
jgi:adenylate kinase family enzyme